MFGRVSKIFVFKILEIERARKTSLLGVLRNAFSGKNSGQRVNVIHVFVFWVEEIETQEQRTLLISRLIENTL